MKKTNRLVRLLFILILSFIFFIYIRNKPINYTKTYNINSFNITEEYKNDTKEYLFVIKYKKVTYPYLINNKYSKRRKLINNIKIYEMDDETCILAQSDIIDFYPICSNENGLYTYNNSKNDFKYKYKTYNSESDNYKKIDIYTYLNNSYLLYNYKGFYLLNNNNKKDIKLFNKDIYKIDLIYQKDNYLLIPNYNQSHYFNKIYCININNGQIIELNSVNNISYNSIFINSNNKILLEDKKEDVLYRINIEKKTIEETNEDYSKSSINNYYEIIDNKLYKVFNNYKIKVSDMQISNIVNEYNSFVYFISDDSLYAYNDYYGIIRIMSNFEWNFNNTNMVFLY